MSILCASYEYLIQGVMKAMLKQELADCASISLRLLVLALH